MNIEYGIQMGSHDHIGNVNQRKRPKKQKIEVKRIYDPNIIDRLENRKDTRLNLNEDDWRF
jgi:hypothetical protein